MTRRQKLALSLVASAAAAAVTVPIVASSAPGDPLLPDLVSDPPAGPRFDTYDPVNDVDRLLIRFDGYVHNDGDGPVDIQGNPQLPEGSPGGMNQYVWNGIGARTSTAFGPNAAAWTRVTDHPNIPEVVFDESDTHKHWHVQRLAEYSLWNESKSALVVAGNKVGFCMYDSSRVPPGNKGPASPVYGDALTGVFCRREQPGATQLREGISEGYRDIYDWTLDYQWIDASNVAPGVYHLAGRMDPENVIKEKDETNNGYAYSTSLVVPGYRAKAVGPASTPHRTAVNLTLASDSFTTPPASPPAMSPAYGETLGPRRFRIETLPAGGILKNGNGTLSVGSELPDGFTTLQYVPNNNFSGVDGFEFSAIDTNSKYPMLPSRATASVVVGGSGASVVSLSGAPGQMVVGSQVQLTATSSAGAIQWSTTGGSITPAGVLTAPATVPPGGTITVRAALVDDIGAFRDVVIPVVAAAVGQPQPIVPPPGTTAALSRPGVLVNGRNITVTLQVNRAGTVGVGLYRGATRLEGCSTRSPAGQTISCKFRLAKPYDPGTIVIRAALTTSAGKVFRTRSTAGPANFRKLVVRRSGRRVAMVVTPQRPGFVTVVMTARGAPVGRCAARVRPNGSLACSRTLSARALGAKVNVAVSFRDNQGRLAVRELRR